MIDLQYFWSEILLFWSDLHCFSNEWSMSRLFTLLRVGVFLKNDEHFSRSHSS